MVCRHALDTLISIAKMFPTYFLPAGKAKEVTVKTDTPNEDFDSPGSKKNSSTTTGQSSPKLPRAADNGPSSSSSLTARHDAKSENDFWNILVRLDGASGKSKGKGKTARLHSII